jgi:hypothetical protein
VTASPGGNPTLGLTGTGQSPAILALAPQTGSLANFGMVTVGTPKSQTFVVSNTGSLTSSAITVSLSALDHFSIQTPTGSDCAAGTTLAPAATCTVSVAFPGANGGGAVTATLRAMATMGGTATLALSGNAHKFNTVQVDPSPSFNYGMVILGTTPPKTQVFVVKNTGDDVATALGVSTSGDAFSLTNAPGDCMNGVTDLNPGATCTLTVAFSPGFPGGSFSGTVSAQTFQNFVTLQTFAVTLSGTGVLQ